MYIGADSTTQRRAQMRRICRWLICATIAPSNLPPQRPKRHIQPVALKEKAVGVVLREFREQAGQSQETLSAECGFDRTYISRVERGIINPTISRLWHIAGYPCAGSKPGSFKQPTRRPRARHKQIGSDCHARIPSHKG